MAKNRRRCFLDIAIDGREAGRIVFELFDELAPKTTENFLQLCTGKAGIGKTSGKPLTYKGSTFHRVIKDFMIQGGDFTEGNGTGGESIYGGSFDDEPFLARHDQPFLLSMANKGPNTNGSQFFITVKPTPHLNGKHVVFGKVVSGKEVASEIEHLKVDSKSRPLADVIIINSGELVRKRRQEGSSESDSSDDERQKNRKKRRDSGTDEKENGNNEVQVSSVKPEDLPPEPANQHSFLMRRSTTPEHRRKEKKEREKERRRESSRDRHRRRDDSRDRRRRSRSRNNRSPRRRSRDRGNRDRDNDRSRRNERVEKATGVKTKGRGTMRFSRMDRSRTPPHWKREEARLMTLDDLHTKRESLGGGDTIVRRMKGTHSDANEDVAPEDKNVKVEADETQDDVVEKAPVEMEGGEGIDIASSDDESDGGDIAEEAKEQERMLKELDLKKQKEAEERKIREAKQAEEDAKKEKERERDNNDMEEDKTQKSETPERRSRSSSPSGRRSRSPEKRESRTRSAERKKSPSRSGERKKSRSRSVERKSRSRSTDKKKSRSRSSGKKSRSRSRDRKSPERRRSKERRRSRSRSHDRHRSRSTDRRRHDSRERRRSDRDRRDRRSPERRRRDSRRSRSNDRDSRRRRSRSHSRRRGRSRSAS